MKLISKMNVKKILPPSKDSSSTKIWRYRNFIIIQIIADAQKY